MSNLEKYDYWHELMEPKDGCFNRGESVMISFNHIASVMKACPFLQDGVVLLALGAIITSMKIPPDRITGIAAVEVTDWKHQKYGSRATE